MPLTPFTGILGKKRAAHLLRRATFGPTKAQIDAFANLTANQAIAQLFQVNPPPNPPIDPATGQTWIGMPPAQGSSEEGDLQEAFKYWWLGQMLKPSQNAREKIIFFLHTHFTTIQSFVERSRALYYQNALFRLFALDKTNPLLDFKTLTKKLCVDNAMVKFLDSNLNVRGNPNENFARELLELYSIGKGREGQGFPEPVEQYDYYYFTEQDVQAGAKVFSGFNVDDTYSNTDADTNLPRGVVRGFTENGFANQHDNQPKEFSNRLGNTIIQPNPALLDAQGRATEESMLDEIDQFVEMAYAQPETAKYICRRIYRFFVYHNISDTIYTQVIENMANTFVSSGYKLQAVLEDLFQSQHFYDAGTGALTDDNIGSVIKSPLDLQVGTFRFFEVALPDLDTQSADFYGLAEGFLKSVKEKGLDLYEPYEVAGYAAYHQFPEYHRNWISTNSLTQRYNFMKELFTIENIMENEVGIDLLAFTKANFTDAIALDPDQLVRTYASYLLPMYTEGSEITTERISYFKQRFLRLGEGLPQGSLAFWQFSYSNAANIPQSAIDARGMLQDLLNAMLQSPEYQLF
jgi:uncharacterized protein (DUF1800 family)